MLTIRLFLAATLLATGVSAASSRDSLDAYFRAHIRDAKVPGMVVGIVDGNDEWVRAYGLADVENQTPMKPESSFRLASITKTMTAVAILQLVERGKIDLDAEVQTYVPYFPRKPWPVTVRQLLGHLAGIPHYVNRATEQHIKEHKTTREAVAIFENFDLVAEPGTKYSYSSYGYVLLGAVIEHASGVSYEEYMRTNIWAPLGMTSTRVDDPLALIPNRVRGYQLIDGRLANSEFVDVSSRFAAGGTRTTVPDLLRFARGMMGGKLISAASFELLSTPMQTREGKLTDYAMGCFVHPIPGFADTNGRFAISNSGGQQETRTFIMIFPKRGVAFATAMNAEINTGAEEVERIAQSIFGEPFDFSPAAAARADRIVLAAMQSVFTFGSADVEAHPRPPEGRASEAEALHYFASIIDDAGKGVSERALLDRIDAGRQPRTGAPLVVLGRKMAEALRGDYSSKGAPIFFRDYAALGRNDLPRSLTARIERFARDWASSTPPEVRQLAIDNETNVDELAQLLRAHLGGRSVVPNLAWPIADRAMTWAAAGDARAAAAAALAVEIFPGAADAYLASAVARAASGDVAGARAALIRVRELTTDEGATTDLLNRSAYAFASGGHTDHAVDLLTVATEAFPRVANLFDSLGELAANAGQRERAIKAYERALEIDPKLKSAEAALAKLRGR
jgi:CubicO group peptidase (beta-lactamase class C family)